MIPNRKLYESKICKSASRKKGNEMRLIDEIFTDQNIKEAIKRVRENKGAPGIDAMSVSELDEYFKLNQSTIIAEIKAKKYKPQPVRRVYIPKANGKKRPLGIPTAVDRVVQQAVAQKLMDIYEPLFSEHSHGFRPNRSCHTAMKEALEYLNEGYEWIIDLDIEKFFDTVNQDKLISILREQVKDAEIIHLIRGFLRAGVMEDGLTTISQDGLQQGGPSSPILSGIYLDKFDKELESRGLHFVRYADDCNIFVKSETAADRVMKSVSSWLERKLFLKVNMTKTKVTKPTGGAFLGFSYWKSNGQWKCKPLNDRKAKLYDKCREILLRRKAQARPIGSTFKMLNQVIRGWINYYRIGSMKMFLQKFGEWLRHKVRVVLLKQWKKPRTIYTNLMKINNIYKYNFTHEDIFKVANSRKGIFARSNGDVINYILSPKILAKKTKSREGLLNPLKYYLKDS